jgi:hypothetical protein
VWLRVRTEEDDSERELTEVVYLVIQQNVTPEVSQEARAAFVLCSLLASHSVYMT